MAIKRVLVKMAFTIKFWSQILRDAVHHTFPEEILNHDGTITLQRCNDFRRGLMSGVRGYGHLWTRV